MDPFADEADGMMEMDVHSWLTVPEPDPAADLLASRPASLGGLGACGPVLLCHELAQVQLLQREYDLQ